VHENCFEDYTVHNDGGGGFHPQRFARYVQHYGRKLEERLRRKHENHGRKFEVGDYNEDK
jgi:hypothetical protein